MPMGSCQRSHFPGPPDGGPFLSRATLGLFLSLSRRQGTIFQVSSPRERTMPEINADTNPSLPELRRFAIEENLHVEVLWTPEMPEGGDIHEAIRNARDMAVDIDDRAEAERYRTGFVSVVSNELRTYEGTPLLFTIPVRNIRLIQLHRKGGDYSYSGFTIMVMRPGNSVTGLMDVMRAVVTGVFTAISVGNGKAIITLKGKEQPGYSL